MINSSLKIFTVFISAFFLLLSSCQAGVPADARQGQTPPSHTEWNSLLKKHVASNGNVDYKGFKKDIDQLNAYLKTLQAGVPDPKTWSKQEQLAYWINAYNAFTVKLIVDNYPVKSIKDLNSAIAIPTINSIWDDKFFTLGGKKFSLNMIEHDILRKDFNEPRIHFAINCASVSCPVLLNEAFTASKLEKQLEKQTREFINDPTKNSISANNVKVSSIFDWFGSDFKNNGSIIDFLNRYSKTKINPNAKLNFLKYNWDLNEQK
jgi:hypothetical protein